MRQTFPLIPNPDRSSTVTEEFSHERTWAYLPHPVREAKRLREAQLLRERLSSVPFYAKKAKAWKERTGDEMGYWLALYGSDQYTQLQRQTSSTPAPTR